MLDAFPARRGHLHHDHLGYRQSVFRQQLPERLEPLLDALGVIQPVDAEDHRLGVAEFGPDLFGPGADQRAGRERLDLGDVDRDRERGGVHDPAVLVHSGAARPQAQQVPGQPEEVLRGQRALEADQVGAEQPAQDLRPARQLHEQFDRRERDVQEEADAQVRADRAEHRRHQLQLVVLHPDGGLLAGLLGGRLGEPLVDPPVRLPPAALVDRRLDRVVVQRPQAGVGEALVVPLHVVRGQRDRVQRHPVQLERLGRRLAGFRRATGPADPGAVLRGEYRVQRGHQTARTASPGAPLTDGHLVDGQPVRDHDEGTAGHRISLLDPPERLTLRRFPATGSPALARR